MNQKRMLAAIAIGPLAVAHLAVASAQDLPQNVKACAAELDDARRLACYDREVSKLGTRAADQQPSMETTTLSAEERFGMTDEMERKKQNGAQSPKLEHLTATVTKISHRRQGEFVMTLDNGQVWAQKHADSAFAVRVGDRVTIKTAAMGSYLLAPPSGRATRVTRVN